MRLIFASLILSFNISSSDVEKELLGVLNTLLDLPEEQDGLTAIDDAMIVGESDVHYGAGNDLRALDDWAQFGGVHTEDSALGHVDDRGTHHAAEDATVGDGESAARKVLKRDLAITSLGSEATETLFKVSEAIVLAVAEDGNDEAGRSGHSGADVDKVAVDHVVVIDNGVDNGLFLQGLDGGLHEGAHEAELDVVLLDEGILDFLAHVHIVAHVDLVEGREESVRLLGFFKSARDCLTHPAHLHTSLDT